MAGSFDTITLRCLGNVPGPRFLNGLVQGDHSVVLAATDDDSGTRWRRGQSASGHSWNLKCLGDPPPGVDPGQLFLAGSASGGVLIALASQTPGGTPETWHARPVPGGFTLENVALRDAGVAARFLDGRTGTGDVGLAPNTDPPFTGTHWEVGFPPNLGDDNPTFPADNQAPE